MTTNPLVTRPTDQAIIDRWCKDNPVYLVRDPVTGEFRAYRQLERMTDEKR